MVDDDPEWIELIARALNRPALIAHTHCFTEPEAALEYVRLHSPSIVITDLRMPVIDGRAVCRAVRTMHPTVPVILVSSNILTADEVSACGANTYVSKRTLNTALAPAIATLLGEDATSVGTPVPAV